MKKTFKILLSLIFTFVLCLVVSCGDENTTTQVPTTVVTTPVPGQTTVVPTQTPTAEPTVTPTVAPTVAPTKEPSIADQFDCISIARALELCEEYGSSGTPTKYYVYGTIKTLHNATYGEMTITDGENDLYVYGTASADGSIPYSSLEVKPVVGDEVVLYGTLKNYNNTKKEMEKGWIVAHKQGEKQPTVAPENNPVVPEGTGIWTPYQDQLVSFTYAEYLATEAGDAGTSQRYIMFGTIKSISNPNFGEMTIVAGEEEFYVYGTYSADGATRYSELTEQPVAGDQVVLSCILSTFSGKAQVKSGWILDFYHEEVTIDPSQYPALTVSEARTQAKGVKMQLTGVVAKITYANGYIPDGFFLIDNTSSIYVHGIDITGQVEEGNTVTIACEKTYYVLETEQANAQKHGYEGCNQVTNAILLSNDNGKSDFDKTWITETTVKEIVNAPLNPNITTQVFKVNALIKKVEGTGFTNYYIDDLDGYTGSYTYTKCNGGDFAYLDQFDGKICTVYLSAINCKSESSGCFYRFIPVLVIDENYQFDLNNTCDFALEYFAKDQFLSLYEANPELEVVTEASSTLLGFEGVTFTYSTSDETIAYFQEVEGKLVFNTAASGDVIVKITATYGTLSKSIDIPVKVQAPVEYDTITVEQVVATAVGETVYIEGIVASSLVNRDGFYIADETGFLSVLVTNKSDLQTIKSGDKVVITGMRDLFNPDTAANKPGQICVTQATILVNKYGNHEYPTNNFIQGKTFQELYDTPYTEQHSNEVYVVTGKFVVITSGYSTQCKLTSVDGTVLLTLYCSGAGQYSFLNDIADKEAVFEIAMCNWNKKTFYAYCVISATCEGVKYVNELNFK